MFVTHPLQALRDVIMGAKCWKAGCRTYTDEDGEEFLNGFEGAVVSRADSLVMKLQKRKSVSEQALMNSVCG